jgi:hypothetical protein
LLVSLTDAWKSMLGVKCSLRFGMRAVLRTELADLQLIGNVGTDVTVCSQAATGSAVSARVCDLLREIALEIEL